MNERWRNAGLLALVVLISVLPLWLHQPVEGEEAFAGADNRAQQEIGRLAPDYQPWFKPLLEPASNEIASLLFALQAAIGAGVIGYWLGCVRTRERLRRQAEKRLADEVDRKNGPSAGKTPDAD